MVIGNRAEKLKSSIKKGDKTAFRQIYRKYYPGLCVIAHRYIRDHGIAEEIVQDVFLKLWEGRKTIEITGELHNYLYSAVRNGSVNYIRRLLIERKYSESRTGQIRDTLNNINISQEDGSSILIANEMEKKINEAVESLPDRCREIFLMHRNEGLRYSQIAEKLKLSPNTVQRQISIALEKLREKLAPYLK